MTPFRSGSKLHLMTNLSIKKTTKGHLEEVVHRVTDALKEKGFGVLTRIDFHTKIKEKLGKDIDPVVILGACNPQIAYQAFHRNTDVTSLIPCNATIRQIKPKEFSVELTKPSALMEILGESDLVSMAREADALLESVAQKV